MKVALIRQLLASSGAEKELVDLLASVDDAEELQLVEVMRPGVAKLAKTLATERTRVSKLNQAAISALLDELQNTKHDNATFEDVIKRATKDRALKVADAVEVAKLFTGEPRKFKSKLEAFDAILKRQIADKRGAARSSQISGIF